MRLAYSIHDLIVSMALAELSRLEEAPGLIQIQP